MLFQAEMKYTNYTIKNIVSTAGIYGDEFEKKIKKLTKAKHAIQ